MEESGEELISKVPILAAYRRATHKFHLSLFGDLGEIRFTFKVESVVTRTIRLSYERQVLVYKAVYCERTPQVEKGHVPTTTVMGLSF
jgi:hypothetical protein